MTDHWHVGETTGRKVIAIALLSASCVFSTITFARDRPNVVIMIADNLGFGDVSIHNVGTRGGMRTPNIDALARDGLHLTQFLVEPTCTASRAALMTGRYAVRLGLSWFPAGPENTLQPEELTLGELFQSAGYDTAYIGKWHLDAMPESQPQNQGFDEWRVGFSGSSDGVLYEDLITESGAPEALRKYMEYWIVEADGPGEATRVRRYDREYRRRIEADIAKAAESYISRHAPDDAPFLLVVGWTRPHYPNDPASEFAGASGTGIYGDSVVELDSRIGDVMTAIRDTGIDRDTLVVFLSDNGPTKTTAGFDELYAGSSGPFRGELGDAYEGSIRTLAVLRWPGRIVPRRSNAMVAIHDLAPTLAGIIGVSLPDDRPIDGIDQGDLIFGRSAQSARQSLISFLGGRIIGVRWRQWRIYPVEFVSTASDPPMGGYTGVIRELGYPQIYNIESDPGERVNLAPVAGWVETPYSETIRSYLDSLETHPNPPAATLTDFRR
jgi:arylsulfatase